VKKVVGYGKRKWASFVWWGENAVVNVSVGGPTSSDLLGAIFHGELGGDS
jgi:hypothetical protein